MNPRIVLGLVALYCAAILTTTTIGEDDYVKTTAVKKRKSKGFDHPLEFVKFHREIRTADDQKSPAYRAGYRLRELQASRQRATAKGSIARALSEIEWTERGPGNVPGRTRALFNLPDPANKSWLAGAATGGIWKTTDGGDTWIEKNDNLTHLPVSSFGADDAATKIYAGTGEFVSTLFSAQGGGLLVSTDKGDTWTPIPSTQNNDDFALVTRLIVHPTNPNIVVVTSVPSDLNLDDNTSAIMRTTDGGATWTKVKEIEGIFEQIIYTPGNFNFQYVTENGVGVWKSTDAGLTWTLSNTGMSTYGRVELAVSPVNPQRIFASAEGSVSGAESDLYVSNDAGANWSIVELRFNNAVVDFLGNDPNEPDSQGFYDNTIICDPFDENVVYFGGVNLWQTSLGNSGGTLNVYRLQEINTSSFLFLQSFSNIEFDNGRLTAGTEAQGRKVEIRFGPGRKQFAHRFLVPANTTSGVAANQYAYASYVEVPFEAWDVTNNKQLMVSFRDQNRNGVFDLVSQYLTAGGTDALLNSREYLYIHSIDYSTSPSAQITVAGGQEVQMMFNVFPALADGAVWNANALPTSTLLINNTPVPKYTSTTKTVADAYRQYDGKNPVDQVNLDKGVHPDHHFMVAIVTNEAQKQYKILLGNDGGVFISNESSTPGVVNGNWSFKGFGYNTGQFYGVDKRPGADQYIGGLQDNGTRISPINVTADAATKYGYALGGDGFEVLWHSRDDSRILATIYNGDIYRSVNGGTSWASSVSGLTPGGDFPFFTKLANSKDFPDRVFTVGAKGIHYSENFATTWKHTPIASNFAYSSSSSLDVEVSRANANIVWAGSGMSNTPNAQRNLFVSKDGGKTFSQTNNFTSATLGSITGLATHPLESQTAYALFSFANRPKILRTTDLGETWTELSGFGNSASSANGFPNVAVYCLYVRPDNPDILWAGTEIGIVESTDNGATWSLLMNFPKVAVWDMKGQDNQVVIATHGRGIWTATLPTSQSNTGAPAITAAGMAPDGKLALRVENSDIFEDVQIVVNNAVQRTYATLTEGIHEWRIPMTKSGTYTVLVRSTKDGAPYVSNTRTVSITSLLPVKNSYSTYFSSVSDFALTNFVHQRINTTAATERAILKTRSPYPLNDKAIAQLKHPIRVGDELPVIYFNDIAIIEPANDFVVLEATKNGLDWEQLSEKYDARLNTKWLEAFDNKKNGDRLMLEKKEFQLDDKFNVGDTLIIQWRLSSNATVNAWGWAIDYVAIQEVPVSTEPLTNVSSLNAYPNPANQHVDVSFTLTKPSGVELQLMNTSGQSIVTRKLGTRTAGQHVERVNTDQVPVGVYVVIVQTSAGRESTKIVVRR